MPLFHDLSPQDRLRIELKRWEKDFTQVNGRKPSKGDIEAAGSDVKSLYKKYWSLQTGHVAPSSSSKKRPLGDQTCNSLPIKKPLSSKTSLDKTVESTNQSTSGPAEERIPVLPTGVWGENLLKKNFNEVGTRAKESAVCKPFVNNLMKSYMGKKFVSKSLKRSKRKSDETSSTSASISSTVTSPASSLLTANDSRNTDTFDGNPFVFRSENISLNSLVIRSEGEVTQNSSCSHPDNNVVFSTPVSLDLHDSNAVDSLCISGYGAMTASTTFLSTLSSQASSSGSFKENMTRQSSSLFSDHDDDEDNDMKAVKEHISNEIKEMDEFAGCELLPLNFQAKKVRKKSAPTAKSIKKKNDEYCCRVDMKKKSFASKGYKKINVQKLKRQSHYKKKRKGNRCFNCGQEGHWASQCTSKDPSQEEEGESLVLYRNAPVLPADCIVNTDDDEQERQEEQQDQESIHHGRQEMEDDIRLFDFEDEMTRETLFF